MPSFSMFTRPLAFLVTAGVLATGCGARTAPGPTGAGQHDADAARRIEADLRFLADDLLEGRHAGTRGYDLAAHYVQSRFHAMGLQPAGDDGRFLQAVSLVQGLRIPDGAQMQLEREGVTTSFGFERDFLPGLGFDQPHSRISAPLVFVGHGVHAPELGHDDFSEVDVEGRIALVFPGAPERFPNDERAFHSSGREKAAALVARGAVGMVTLTDPEREQRNPWARGARNWLTPGMRLLDAQGEPVDTFPELVVTASASLETTRTLLGGGPVDADAVFEHLEAGTLEGFALPGTLTLAQRTVLEPVTSHNVVARLPGVDPDLAGEHVVFTAHLDHVGIGAPVDGDRIYNGAFDNALGTAIMVEAARTAVARGPGRRSQLFVALTAEEKGLLGAYHFAGHAGVEGRLVANINIDMPLLFTQQADIVAYGVEHSDLLGPVERAAAAEGARLSPDPIPDEVVFIRSDQFAFVRAGIPAVYLDAGIEATDPDVDAMALVETFLREHYHQPSDQADLPIHYPDAARLARIAARIGGEVADAEDAPRWNPGNFFGERFAAERPASTRAVSEPAARANP